VAILALGEFRTFPGDVVLRYSLTNAGKYYVKAVAEVRSEYRFAQPISERMITQSRAWRELKLPYQYTQARSERMVIETPAVEVTVQPRQVGEGSPMPEVYPERVRSRLVQPGEEPPPHLVATHPKPKGTPAKRRVGRLSPEAR
jgi:hypothetical protein